jgi:hypothetical protein
VHATTHTFAAQCNSRAQPPSNATVNASLQHADTGFICEYDPYAMESRSSAHSCHSPSPVGDPSKGRHPSTHRAGGAGYHRWCRQAPWILQRRIDHLWQEEAIKVRRSAPVRTSALQLTAGRRPRVQGFPRRGRAQAHIPGPGKLPVHHKATTGWPHGKHNQGRVAGARRGVDRGQRYATPGQMPPCLGLPRCATPRLIPTFASSRRLALCRQL